MIERLKSKPSIHFSLFKDDHDTIRQIHEEHKMQYDRMKKDYDELNMRFISTV